MGQLSVDLSGKTAVVTGGGTGIGKAIALGMGRCGASVVVNYCRSEAEAEQTASEIKQAGGQAKTVQADLTRWPDVESLFKSAVVAFGSLDILVNNAGGNIEKTHISDMTEEVWDRTIDLNLKSIFFCCKAAIPLLADGSGRIINISSISGFSGGGALGVAYGAAKGAVITMTRGLAHELAPRRITVNSIAPGVIDTLQHTLFTPPQDYEALINIIPLRRDGKPDDLVGTALLLASDAGSFLTGEIINVNGGMRMV